MSLIPAACSLLGDVSPEQCQTDTDCNGIEDRPAGTFVCERALCVERTAGCRSNLECQVEGGPPQICGREGQCEDLTLGSADVCAPVGFDANHDDYLIVGVLTPGRSAMMGSLGAVPTVEHVVEMLNDAGLATVNRPERRALAVVCNASNPEDARAAAVQLEASVGAHVLVSEQNTFDLATTFNGLKLPIIATQASHAELHVADVDERMFHLVGEDTTLVDAFAGVLEAVMIQVEADRGGTLPPDFKLLVVHPRNDVFLPGPPYEEVIAALGPVLLSYGFDPNAHVETLADPPYPDDLTLEAEVAGHVGNTRPDVIVSLQGRNFVNFLPAIELLFPVRKPFYILDQGARTHELLTEPSGGFAFAAQQRTVGIEHASDPARFDAYANAVAELGKPHGHNHLHDALLLAGLAAYRIAALDGDLSDHEVFKQALRALDDGDEPHVVIDLDSLREAKPLLETEKSQLRFQGTTGPLMWTSNDDRVSTAAAYCPRAPVGEPLRVGIPPSDVGARCFDE